MISAAALSPRVLFLRWFQEAFLFINHKSRPPLTYCTVIPPKTVKPLGAEPEMSQKPRPQKRLVESIVTACTWPNSHPMARLKGKQKEERERLVLLALKDYQNSTKPSMRASAEKFSIPWTTLRDRLNGAQNRRESHRQQQILTPYEEETIVKWCARMDDWGFPMRLGLVKEMAGYLVKKREIGRTLGKHWLARFLERNPELASKFTMRLDRQRAYADNPTILKDYFEQVRSPIL